MSEPIRHLDVLTRSTELAVSFGDVKSYLQLTHMGDQALVEAMIRASTTYFETFTDSTVVETTYRLYLPSFADPIRLWRAPVQAVTSIKYDDPDGNEQTVAPSVYELAATSTPPHIRLAAGESWPSTSGRMDAVRVDFAAGLASADLPHDKKMAICHLVRHMYDTPDAELSDGVKRLMWAASDGVFA